MRPVGIVRAGDGMTVGVSRIAAFALMALIWGVNYSVIKYGTSTWP